jgi:hypothetical protein
MRQKKIPKGGGRWRTVWVPSRREREALRAIVPTLAGTARRLDVHDVMHGFVAGRSPVTNALVHRGRAYTLALDLRDWFDSVRRDQLAPHVAPDVLDRILVDGAPRQGLPTSPAAANIAAAALDAQIVAALAGRGVYTRYADDLAISVDDEAVLRELADVVPRLVAAYGWQVHPRKTRLQAAAAGRRVITGVAVDDGIFAPRAARRRLRAARHQRRTAQARGLAEWCLLRLPGAARLPGTARRIAAASAAPAAPPPPSAAPVARRIIRPRPGG